mmetsp:Transcript_64586/g.152773  ORF Transcript_64586/g.152773 Transcript_64586/m.152773 type:complete len:237 (-) Transcript_64586:383-1093(-)
MVAGGDRGYDLIPRVGGHLQNLGDTMAAAVADNVREQTSNALLKWIVPDTHARKHESQSPIVAQQRLVSPGVDGHVREHLQRVLQHFLWHLAASSGERSEELRDNLRLHEIGDGFVLGRTRSDRAKHSEGNAHVLPSSTDRLDKRRGQPGHLHETPSVRRDQRHADELLQGFEPLSLLLGARRGDQGRYGVQVGTLVHNHPSALTPLLLLHVHGRAQQLLHHRGICHFWWKEVHHV